MINPNDWPQPDGQTLFHYLAENSFCSDQYKLLYVATPKVACTSLKWWFAKLEGYAESIAARTDSSESSPELIIHDTFYKVAPDVTGLTPEELLKALSSDDYFRFAVVRNPYKRIFSAWQSKLLLREPLQIQPYISYDFFHQPIECASDIALAFEGFLKHLASHEAPNYRDAHWAPQIDILRPDLISYTKLAQIENLHELRSALAEHVGLGFQDPFSLRATNESLISYSPEFITDRAAELIRSLYAQDFKLFGYDNKKPASKEKFSDEQLKVALKAISLIRGRHQRLVETRSELDAQVTSLNQAVTERDGQIANLNQTVTERDEQIANLNQTVTERDEQIASFNQALQDARSSLGKLLLSNSWRITKPLRFVRRISVSKSYVILRAKASNVSRDLWYSLPLSFSAKRKFKDAMFSALPWIFGWTKAYRTWASFNTPENFSGLTNRAVHSQQAYNNEYVRLFKGKPLIEKPVKLICFYLPQFHAIPENNAWWGNGFTEWTNVQPAQPQFDGHYQPHVPGELGYYNLLDPSVQSRQVELAKLYGIEGFCFYFYWFGGKRLLETPIENYLNDSSLDLPFCLCWANENWSRRWDGLDSEILMEQHHSPEDDLAFIQHVASYMHDPRYIRIGGKPLLLVYRPSLLPSAKETAKRWREWCINNDIGEIFLAYTQSFETVDPKKYGFDAAIEFPPNNSSPPNITDSVSPLAEDFACTVYDWRVFVERSDKYKQPSYKLFRSVCPSWDNTARRKNRGTVFLNNSPNLYKRWLKNAINYTVEQYSNPDERLVFVNAWNEWAEGAHLEPDIRYGYAYLQATRDALSNTSDKNLGAILLVTHDCHPHGAQLLILETAKQFKDCGFEIFVLALGGGLLLDDFKKVGNTLNIEESGEQSAKEFLTNIRATGTVNAITSTVVCGRVVPQLKDFGFKVLSLIHELPGVIHEMKQEDNAEMIARFSDKVVFPANLIYQRFVEIASVSSEKVVIRHQGVVRKNPYKNSQAKAHQLVCKKHNLPKDTQIVLSIAYMDVRKGPDLFVEMAAQVLSAHPKAVFIWVGHAETEMAHKVISRVKELGLQEKVLFVGFDREPMVYYAAASVYALTSREDPFPNVVLESVEAGVPVVAFNGASGAGEFILENGGRLANYLDTVDFAHQVSSMLARTDKSFQCNSVSLRQYALDLLHYLDGFPRVSVVIPNYNYDRYITERLDSIYNQTFPIYEVLILDDASSDKSVVTISNYIERTGNEAHLIINEKNSGSVFRQWKKGVNSCKGDLVWIAEADDLAETGFLQELAPAFKERQLMLSYCQSNQINGSGRMLTDSYLEYTLGASDCCLTDYCRDGREEITKAMCIKNTIPNVSAVLFRRLAIQEALEEVGEEVYKLRVAGDWLLYLHVLLKGKVCFSKESLNYHRRHTNSVTSSMESQKHLQEIIQMQRFAISLVLPSDELITLAENYINTLCDQFKLPRQKKVHGCNA